MPDIINDSLDPDKIKLGLDIATVGSDIVVFKSTSSTNDIAAEYARDRANDGLAVFAEQQTSGRGRAANKWLSTPSQSVLCSVVLADCPLDPELLSITVAVAVADAVGPQARIKWPNDIFLNARKVAGILLESKTYDYGTACIVGMGINCHQNSESFPAELRPSATSLDMETGSTCNRISVARRLLTSLDQHIGTARTDSTPLIDRWKQLSIQLNQRLTLIYDGREFTGNCTGIDPQKGLILRLDSGAVRFFHAAQTSVAK